MFNWNIESKTSSKYLQAPEIILQTAKVNSYEVLADSSKIIDDGVISKKDSLAKALLDSKKCLKNNKVFIGMPGNHSTAIQDPSYLVSKIEAFLTN